MKMPKTSTQSTKQEIANAIKQICDEKNIPYESVIETIEQALAAAYRKDFGQKNQNIKANFTPETGKIRVFDVKTVVEDLPPPEEAVVTETVVEPIKSEPKEEVKSDGKKTKKKGKKAKDEVDADSEGQVNDSEKIVETKSATESKSDAASEVAAEVVIEKPKFNPRTDLQITDALALKKDAKVGDEIITELEIPDAFGRMAAQTAKQVIIQRLREAERNVLYQDFKAKEGQVVTGIVQRREGRLVLIDLGAAAGILPPDQQVETENYNSGQRYRVYISEVRETSKGPEIIVSRVHPEIVRQLFALEVPEISSGTVVIKSISREAGSRSKVAVATDDSSIDPIGSCVGQRGTRIQTIINELGGEKIDIIEYSDDPARFIANALSPAKTISVETNEAERLATVKVRSDQLSLAIGKAGQNVRLAAKLTGWRIDIIEATVPGGKPEDVKKAEEVGESDVAKEEVVTKETEKLEIKKLRNEELEKKDEEEISKSENQETEETKGTEEVTDEKSDKVDTAEIK